MSAIWGTSSSNARSAEAGTIADGCAVVGDGLGGGGVDLSECSLAITAVVAATTTIAAAAVMA